MTPKFAPTTTVVTAAQCAAAAVAARSITVDHTPFDAENPKYPWEPCVYPAPIDCAWLDQFQKYGTPRVYRQEAA